jgi:hypothetical protein
LDNKTKIFDNQLSHAEEERLVVLIEELSEAQKIACKILRHGYDSVNPLRRNDGTNRSQLHVELGDVQGTMQMMHDRGDIDLNTVDVHARRRRTKTRYFHHQ